MNSNGLDLKNWNQFFFSRRLSSLTADVARVDLNVPEWLSLHDSSFVSVQAENFFRRLEHVYKKIATKKVPKRKMKTKDGILWEKNES